MRGPPLAASATVFLMYQLAVDCREASSFLLPANTNGALQGAKSRWRGLSEQAGGQRCAKADRATTPDEHYLHARQREAEEKH